ncbi:MAG: SDR family NAD(P)-dependent oxidoreductase [Sphingorhabdus sp.]
MKRLTGKTAMVTGGARGIGEGIVRRFVAEGANVLITDVLETEGQQLASELGDKTAFASLDVTSSEAWNRALTIAEEKFGQLDILVNNAGILKFARLDDLSEDDIRQIINVNLIGTIMGSQAAIPFIERAGGGSIVNMSSADGISGANGLTAYCASKFGVRGFTKSLALELGPRGIRVNSIHPGGILTPMANPTNVPRETYDKGYWIYPAQRSGSVDDIGAAAAYLASDDGAYCYGTELSVDGGLNAGHYYMSVPGAPQPPES